MHGRWVLPRHRDSRCMECAWNVGVSLGENELARKDGCSPDECIECNIIGLSLYTWCSDNSIYI